MTELTPAERERIFLEEKARHEAREELERAARLNQVAAHHARQRRTALAVLGIGLVILVVAVVSQSGAPKSTAPGVGEEGRIASGAKTVIAAVDDASFDAVMKGQEAHDQTGLMAVIFSGRAFFIDEGTRVLVIDRSTFRRKVRTLEGPAAGRAGWIPAEWVRK